MTWQRSLSNLADDFRWWSYRSVHEISSALYLLTWRAYNVINDFRSDRMQYLDNLVQYVPWPLESIAGWFVDRLKDALWWATDQTLSLPTRLIEIFNEHFNDSAQSWDWALIIYYHGQSLIDMAESIGLWIDDFSAGVWSLVWPLLNLAIDPVGYGVSSAINSISEDAADHWGYWVGQTDNRFSALRGILGQLGNLLADNLAEIASIPANIADMVLDIVGFAVGNYLQVISSWVVNPWDSYKSTYGDRGTAILAMLSDAGRSILDAIGAIRTFAESLIDTAIAGLRAEIIEWLVSVQSTIDFVESIAGELSVFLDDPANYVWTRLSPGLWGRLEPWLTTVWDGD